LQPNRINPAFLFYNPLLQYLAAVAGHIGLHVALVGKHLDGRVLKVHLPDGRDHPVVIPRFGTNQQQFPVGYPLGIPQGVRRAAEEHAPPQARLTVNNGRFRIGTGFFECAVAAPVCYNVIVRI
jgi:hypothetical protein